MKKLVAAAALLMSVVLIPAPGPAKAAPATPYYVALGDSRAVGPTWTSTLSGDLCGRTSTAYPNQVAATLGVSFRSVACSGATTTDVLNSHRTLGIVPVAPQVDALSSNTRLVSLSIGGNDIDWANLIAPCFPLVGNDGHCRTNASMHARIDGELAALGPKVATVLAEIRHRSPKARIIVVGHGGYFGSAGCALDAPMSKADAPTVTSFFARFNKVLADAATHSGAKFVDVTAAARGHDACAGNQRWFVGDWPRGDVPLRHPTPLGSRNIARLVVAALR